MSWPATTRPRGALLQALGGAALRAIIAVVLLSATVTTRNLALAFRKAFQMPRAHRAGSCGPREQGTNSSSPCQPVLRPRPPSFVGSPLLWCPIVAARESAAELLLGNVHVNQHVRNQWAREDLQAGSSEHRPYPCWLLIGFLVPRGGTSRQPPRDWAGVPPNTAAPSAP